MSRQNKVNPGMYTQRGRLTQDDAARELKRQRVIGSPQTWQPVQRDRTPPLTAEPDSADANERDPDVPVPAQKAPARVKAAKATKSAAAKAAKTSKPPATPKSRRAAGSAKPARGATRSKARTVRRRG